MTAVKGFYDEELTAETHTGDTNWVNQDTETLLLRIDGGDLVGSNKYAIIARGMLTGSDVNRLFGLRVNANETGGLIAAKSEFKIEPIATAANNGISFRFVHSFTTNSTPGDVDMELKTFFSSATASVDQASLKLVDLTDLGAPNYFETIHADPGLGITKYETTLTDVFTIAGSSLGTDEFLVYAYQRTDVAATNTNYRVELHAAFDTSTSSVKGVDENEGEDSNELRMSGFAIRHKASSGTPNVAIKALTRTDAKMFDAGGYAIAFKTAAWESIVFAYTAGSTLIDTTERTFQNIDTHSPTTTADHYISGSLNLADTGSTKKPQIHVEDDATPIRTGDEPMEHHVNYDALANPMVSVDHQTNILFSDSSDYDLRAKLVADTDNAEHRWLIIWSMELAAGGTAHTATPTEAVGVTDSTPVKQGKERAEPVGVGDDTSRVHAAKRTPTEPVGVTDSTPIKQAKVRAEPVGVTDVTAIQITKQRAKAEPVGVTDTIAVAKTIVVEITEAVGVTDTTTRVAPAVRVATEPVGVTDATPVKQSKVVVEPVGVTDATPVKLVIAQEVTEAVGVTDVTTRDVDAARTVTEPVGVGDETPIKQGKRIEESVGLTDSTADDLTTPGLTEVLTEAVGVTDSLDLIQGKERAEPIGVTDTIVPAKTIRVTITEAVGVTDAVLAAKAIAQTVEAQYLALDGVAGVFASSPHHPDHNVVDTFEGWVYAAAADWSPATTQTFMAHWVAPGDERAWAFKLTGGSRLQFGASSDGSDNENVAHGGNTLEVVGFLPSRPRWVGFQFDGGVVKFFDGGSDRNVIVPVQLGGDQTLASITTINSADAPMEVGSFTNGAASRFIGRIHRARLWDDLTFSALLTDFHADDFNVGDTNTDTAVDSTGKTWTLNGASKVGPVVGVTDETTRIVTAVRVVAESVGVADVITPARVIVREITEDVGVTDATLADLTGPLAFQITITESVGVTDEVVASGSPWWAPDPVGISPAPVGIDHRTPEKESPSS